MKGLTWLVMIMATLKIDFIPGFFLYTVQYIYNVLLKRFVAEWESSTFFLGEGGRRMALTLVVSMKWTIDNLLENKKKSFQNTLSVAQLNGGQCSVYSMTFLESKL